MRSFDVCEKSEENEVDVGRIFREFFFGGKFGMKWTEME